MNLKPLSSISRDLRLLRFLGSTFPVFCSIHQICFQRFATWSPAERVVTERPMNSTAARPGSYGVTRKFHPALL